MQNKIKGHKIIRWAWCQASSRVPQTHLGDGEFTGTGAVVGIKRLGRQHPLAPADVGEVHPEVTPGARPGLAPLPLPGLFHSPLIKAEHLWLTGAVLSRSPAAGRRFGLGGEERVLPQLVVLQGVVMHLGNVIGLDLVPVELPADPGSCQWLGRVLADRQGSVALQGTGHAVGLIDSLIISVHQDEREVGWRETLLTRVTFLLRQEPQVQLHREHKLFELPSVFHRRRYIPRLPGTLLDR